MKIDINESCSSNLIFLRENHLQKDQNAFKSSKLTPNFQNALFLSGYFKSVVTDTKKITRGCCKKNWTSIIKPYIDGFYGYINVFY